MLLLVMLGVSGCDVLAHPGAERSLDSDRPASAQVLATQSGQLARHPAGTLVRMTGEETVYLLAYRPGPGSVICRRPLRSRRLLRSLYDRPGNRAQFEFSDVVLISRDEMARYPVGQEISRPRSLPDNGKSQPDGTLIRAPGGQEVSIVTLGGFRKPFESEKELLSLGYQPENVVSIPDYDDYRPIGAAAEPPAPPGGLTVSEP